MNHDFWKTLHSWLNVAHSDDIHAKKRLLLDLHAQLSDPGLRSDIQRILRLMDRDRRVTASVRKDFRPSMGRKSGLHRHGYCLRRPWPSASPRL
jgi:hypothetical protein